MKDDDIIDHDKKILSAVEDEKGKKQINLPS